MTENESEAAEAEETEAEFEEQEGGEPEEPAYTQAPPLSVHPAGAAKKPAAAPAEMDALQEAELFLNYGRDAQAEELLKDALQSNPANTQIQLKLLSIYANRKDLGKFSSIAKQVKESGDGAAWEQAAALGRAIDPTNPSYEGAGAAPAAVADLLSESGRSPAAMPLDMDVGFNIPMDLDVTAAAHPVQAGTGGMDFDVSSYAAAPAMDLDVTGTHEPVSEPLLPDFDVTGGHPLPEMQHGMDFDVTGSHPNLASAATMDFDVTGSHANVTGGASMEFDITGSHNNIVADAGHGALGSSSFDIGFSSSIAPATGTSEYSDLGLGLDVSASSAIHEQAASTGMDFDISAAPAAAAPAMDFSGEGASAGLGGLDFDITGSRPSVPAESLAATQVTETPSLGGMDFDISAAPAAAAPALDFSGEGASAGLGGLDFDITGSRPSVPAESLAATQVTETPSLGGMDFDISAAPAELAPAALDLSGEEASAGLGGLAFDLSGARSSVAADSLAATQVTETPSAALGGMDFNISSEPGVLDISSGVLSTQSSAVDFDVSGASKTVPSIADEDTMTTQVLGGGMDFDISAPLSAATEAGSGLNFGMDNAASVVIPAAGSDLSSLGGMDFDISATEEGGSTGPALDLKLTNTNMNLGMAETVISPMAEGKQDEKWQDVANKLDLARAFQEMGDVDTARELLGEVLNEGDDQQVEAARILIQQL